MKSISCFTVLFASLLLSAPVPSAHAQLSVYGTVALTDFGFVNSSTSNFKSDTAGFLAGAFYNFPIQSRLTAGIDGHLSYGFGSRTSGTAAAVALRVGFVPTHVALRPYFELGGGIVSSPDPTGAFTGTTSQAFSGHPVRYTNGGLELAFGLDIRLNDSFDLRAIELGAVAAGSNSNQFEANSAFLDTGIVYHFHKHP